MEKSLEETKHPILPTSTGKITFVGVSPDPGTTWHYNTEDTAWPYPIMKELITTEIATVAEGENLLSLELAGQDSWQIRIYVSPIGGPLAPSLRLMTAPLVRILLDYSNVITWNRLMDVYEFLCRERSDTAALATLKSLRESIVYYSPFYSEGTYAKFFGDLAIAWANVGIIFPDEAFVGYLLPLDKIMRLRVPTMREIEIGDELQTRRDIHNNIDLVGILYSQFPGSTQASRIRDSVATKTRLLTQYFDQLNLHTRQDLVAPLRHHDQGLMPAAVDAYNLQWPVVHGAPPSAHQKEIATLERREFLKVHTAFMEAFRNLLGLNYRRLIDLVSPVLLVSSKMDFATKRDALTSYMMTPLVISGQGIDLLKNYITNITNAVQAYESLENVAVLNRSRQSFARRVVQSATSIGDKVMNKYVPSNAKDLFSKLFRRVVVPYNAGLARNYASIKRIYKEQLNALKERLIALRNQAMHMIQSFKQSFTAAEAPDIAALILNFHAMFNRLDVIYSGLVEPKEDESIGPTTPEEIVLSDSLSTLQAIANTNTLSKTDMLSSAEAIEKNLMNALAPSDVLAPIPEKSLSEGKLLSEPMYPSEEFKSPMEEFKYPEEEKKGWKPKAPVVSPYEGIFGPITPKSPSLSSFVEPAYVTEVMIPEAIEEKVVKDTLNLMLPEQGRKRLRPETAAVLEKSEYGLVDRKRKQYEELKRNKRQKYAEITELIKDPKNTQSLRVKASLAQIADVLKDDERLILHYERLRNILNNVSLKTDKEAIIHSALYQSFLDVLTKREPNIEADNIGAPLFKAVTPGEETKKISKGGLPHGKLDLRYNQALENVYEMVEFPRIKVQSLGTPEYSDIVKAIVRLITDYYRPSDANKITTIIFVYYGVYGLTGQYSIGGGSISLPIIKEDNYDTILNKLDQLLQGASVDAESEYGMVGSGGVAVNFVSKSDMPPGKLGHTAFRPGAPDDGYPITYYFQYMKVLRRPEEISNKLTLGAFSSSLTRPHSRVRELVIFAPVTKVGLCTFEAFLYIVEGGKLRSNEEWRQHVYDSLLTDYLVYFDLCQRGAVQEFVTAVLKDKGINIWIYNAYSKKLWCADEKIQLSELGMVYYANHVYVSSLKKLYDHLKLKPEERNMIGFNARSSRIESQKLRLYQLTNMVASSKKSILHDSTRPVKVKIDCFKEEKKHKQINHVHWGFDYETYPVDAEGHQKPYLLVVKRVNLLPEEDKKIKKAHVYYGSTCTLDFLFELLLPLLNSSKDNEVHHFWAYNGAGFDFHFLIKALQLLFNVHSVGSSSSIKTIKITNNIDFLDLACWYNVPYDKDNESSSLRALAARCKTKHQKTQLEHDLVTASRLEDVSFKAEAIKYCVNDVKVLNDLIKILVIDMYEHFTVGSKAACPPGSKKYPHSAASLALTIFKNCFLHDNQSLNSSPLEQYEAERSSYHGGLALGFKTVAKDIKFYDINSSYPAVMMTPMPYRFLRSIRYSSPMPMRKETQLDYNDFDLFSLTQFDYPDNTYIPSLMIKHGSKSMIQINHWRKEAPKEPCLVWGSELRLALEQNARVFVDAWHVYSGEKVFDTYVQYFYEKKTEAKKKHDPILELFNKNLLNSLQGKLGTKDRPDKTVGVFGLVTNDVFAKGLENLNNMEYLGNGIYRADWKPVKEAALTKVGSLVRFPSYIAACGRVNLIRAMLTVAPSQLVYCDTDSIVVANNTVLDKAFVSETILGKFKHETEKDSELMCCFGAKNYVTFNGSKGKVKCKGARTFDDPLVHAIKLLKGETITSVVSPFFTKRFGEVYVGKTTRSLRNTFGLKRLYYGGVDSKPFGDITEWETKQEEAKLKKPPKPKTEEKEMKAKTRLEMLDYIYNVMQETVKSEDNEKLLDQACKYAKELEVPSNLQAKLEAAFREAALDEELYEEMKERAELLIGGKVREKKNEIIDSIDQLAGEIQIIEARQDALVNEFKKETEFNDEDVEAFFRLEDS